MADRKITDLTALTTPASADVLPIVDVSEAAAADKNKKITVGELFKGVPDGTAADPAIAFESDDGNGIFLSTTDTVGIATNGSSRMTVSTTAVTSTLPVIVPDGTAAAPSVAFTGSGTDTGIYSPGVDQVAVATNGTGRLFVDSSGNVGIGTASPGFATGSGLEIERSGPATLRLEDSSGSGGSVEIYAEDGVGSAVYDARGSASNRSHAFRVQGNERVRIDSDGKLGIGTSSPSHDLDILKTASGSTTTARIGATATSGGNSAVLILNSGGTGQAKLRFDYEAATERASISVDTSNQRLDFNTANAASPRMSIDSSGKVGIGTTAPQNRLQVGDYSGANYITVGSSSSTKGGILFADGITGNEAYRGYVEYDHLNDLLVFGTGGADKVTVDGSGRLLVGTASSIDSASKLQVKDGYINLYHADSVENAGYGVNFSSNGGATGRTHARIALAQTAGNGGTLTFSTTADGASSPTERMRIGENGNVLINTTTLGAGIGFHTKLAIDGGALGDTAVLKNAAGSSANTLYCWNAGTTGNNGFVAFGTEGSYTQRGIINYNRGSGVVAYNTTSDYRAKTLVGQVENPGATIDALKVYRGVMNGATVERPMLVAHEAQEVAPYCVTGEKDAVDDKGNPIYQQMDHQVLVPLLIAEIQQLRARVAALEAQ